MDIEAVVLAFARTLVTKHRFVLPVNIASLAPNGSALFSRFTAPPPGSGQGAATMEHVTGKLEDEGFETPFHMLATDATGRAKVGIKRAVGDTVIIELGTDDA